MPVSMNRHPGHPIHGNGHGFFAVESSYPRNMHQDLRRHARNQKKVNAELTRKIGSAIPKSPSGVAKPNPDHVEANRNNKIHSPTRGGTSVQFLRGEHNMENERTASFCELVVDRILVELCEKFGEASGEFISIECLHATALSVGVIDAVDEEEFNSKMQLNPYYRACYHLFETDRNLDSLDIDGNVYTREELLAFIASKSCVEELPDELIELLQEYIEDISFDMSERLNSIIDSGGVIFNAVDLKVTDNGSLVLQLAPSDDLLGLREGLLEVGGVCKRRLSPYTAITIGFFPNYDKMTEEELEELESIILSANEEMLSMNLTVEMDNLSLVQFKVNTLAKSKIRTSPLFVEKHVSSIVNLPPVA